MNLDADDLAAISDLLDALDAWRVKHPLYSMDGTNVWCDGEPLLNVGLGEGDSHVTYPLDAS